MIMLEFVTVKDNMMKFLKTHQDEVICSDLINNNVKFSSLPNGVVQACIDEMAADNAITLQKEEAAIILTLSGRGERLLENGGYVNKLIEEKKLREKESDNALVIYASEKRKKQITILTGTVNTLSVLSAVLFKRISRRELDEGVTR